MISRSLPILVLLCTLCATPCLAKTVILDRVISIAPSGDITLAEHGQVVLANIVIPAGAHPVWPRTGSTWQMQQIATDRYGRTLVILTPPGEKISLQEVLLRNGQAIAYSPAALRSGKKWLAAEAEARAAHRGIWAGQGPVIPAQAAQQSLQQFALVEGTVTRTYKARGSYYINFGTDWKTDFSIAIPRRAWRGFRDKLEVAPGTKLRVRGSVISENGPMVVVTRPEQLERI